MAKQKKFTTLPIRPQPIVSVSNNISSNVVQIQTENTDRSFELDYIAEVPDIASLALSMIFKMRNEIDRLNERIKELEGK